MTIKSEEIIRGIDFKNQKNTNLSFRKNSLVIPTNQVKGKMVQVLFEPKTKLSDSLTYDITAWSLVYAYGLKAIATKENINTVKFATSYYVEGNDVSNKTDEAMEKHVARHQQVQSVIAYPQ